MQEVKQYNLKNGEVCWQSPSNIALVKYWGKKGFQIPANPSLSITLSASYTETKIEFQPGSGMLDFYFENKKAEAFAQKIQKYFLRISEELPFIPLLDFKIYSQNTFPHSAGIASSASAMSALALCLCSIEQDLLGYKEAEGDEFYERASYFARLGSGSAARSVFGNLASWGQSEDIPGSSMLFASPFRLPMHKIYEDYQDSILIVNKGEKKVSSTAGHGLMDGNPFAEARYGQASQNLGLLIQALHNGDLDAFVSLVENEAFTLHGMMMASTPGYVLMEPNTLKIIRKIQDYREQSGAKLCFTLDAGPNVHVLYPQNVAVQVREFIQKQLKPLCEGGQMIDDKMGKGPIRKS